MILRGSPAAWTIWPLRVPRAYRWPTWVHGAGPHSPQPGASLHAEMVKTMADKPIILALAVPVADPSFIPTALHRYVNRPGNYPGTGK